MIKLKKIHLQNYCGYIDTTFDFSSGEKIKPIAAFYGKNGCGKCLKSNTYINSKELGLVQIKELFNNLELKKDTWYNKNFEIEVDGKWEKVNKIYYNGKRKCVNIVTSSGYRLGGSKAQHRILGVVGNKIDWVKLNKIEIGDFICISKKHVEQTRDIISKSEAKILGYLISEGYFSKDKRTFCNADKEILSHFSFLIKKVYGVDVIPRYYSYRGENATITINTMVGKLLKKIGMLENLSGEKIVPFSVMMGSEKIISAFLSTYFEGDGGLERFTISCSSKSFELMHQIHLLLLRLGIISSLKSKISKLSYTNKYKNGYKSWRIVIQGDDIIKFYNKIGFISARKNKLLKDLAKKQKKLINNPNKDIIPTSLLSPIIDIIKNEIKGLKPTRRRGAHFSRKDYQNSGNGLHFLKSSYSKIVKLGISREKLRNCILTVYKESGSRDFIRKLNSIPEYKLIKKYYFDKVIEKTEGKDDLFDLNVDGGYCFWSNGFISHNSSVLRAVSILGNAKRLQAMDPETFQLHFRKLTYHQNYDPTYAGFSKSENPMILTGDFITDEGEKQVIIHSIDGVLKNELPYKATGHTYFINADNPMEMNKFQLSTELSDMFLRMAKAIYGFECELANPVTEEGFSGAMEKVVDDWVGDKEEIKQNCLYTDFIIHKNNSKVHYKSMSEGEKKIATLLRDLCNPLYINDLDIILVDDTERNIYKDRHTLLYDELLKNFPDKQFLITTHSPVLVGFQCGNEYIKGYIPDKYLYDIEKCQNRSIQWQTLKERVIGFRPSAVNRFLCWIHNLMRLI